MNRHPSISHCHTPMFVHVICEAGFRCTSIMTDNCCPSNVAGAKCALPRTHLIGILLLSLITFALKDNTQTHAWTHTSTRNAAQLSIQVSMPSRLYGGSNTPVAQTQRIATRTHGNAQVHIETVTQTPVHHVTIRAPACTQLRLLHVHSVRARGGVWRGNYS